MTLKTSQLSDGAINQYALGDTTGSTAVDAGSSPANGTYNGSWTLGEASMVQGESGCAQSAGNSNVSLPFNVPPSNPTTGAFSLEWVANISGVTSPYSNGSLLSSEHVDADNRGFQIFIGATSGSIWSVRCFFTGSGQTYLGLGAVSFGHVHHYVVTYDGTTLSAYFDGALAGSVAASGNITAGDNIWIGNNPALELAANGLFQDYAFYNTALTADQVSAHYAEIAAPIANVAQSSLVTLVKPNPAAAIGQSGASALTMRDSPSRIGQSGLVSWGLYMGPVVIANAAQSGASSFTLNDPAAALSQAGAVSWVKHKLAYAVGQAGAVSLTVNVPGAALSQSGVIAWVGYAKPLPPVETPVNTSPLNLSAADFLAAFQRLMPRGKIWPRDQDAVQTQALAALMPTYVRNTAAANNLLVDAFPASTVQLLPEWEATLGLPDQCAGADATIEQRQAQVVARFTGRGKNQSPAFFINFAATLGYPITITQFIPFRLGGKLGRPLYGDAWAHVWQVNAPSLAITYLTVGQPLGRPFSNYKITVLQCELQRLAPAHTTLLFNFGS